MKSSDPARPTRRVASALSPLQRGMLYGLMGFAALLLANTVYLLANRAAEAAGSSIFAVTALSLPKIYQIMVLSHTGLGLVVTALAAIFVAWHLAPVWKRRRTHTLLSGIATVVCLLGLAVSGLFIMTAAASRNNEWAWYLHVGLAALVPAAYVLHRLWSYRPPIRREMSRFIAVTGVAAVGLCLIHVALPRGVQLTPEALAARRTGAENVHGSLVHYENGRQPMSRGYKGWVPESEVPVESLFFPSATTTTTGGLLPDRILLQEYAGVERLPKDDFEEFGFAVKDRIGAEGCNRCHQDIVEQWSKSAHRFASFNNPFYEASIDVLREEATRENELILAHLEHFNIPKEKLPLVRSKWCSGCHDPALMIPGRMTEAIERETPAAQAGLTCLACHQIDAIHNNTGNGHYNIADEQESPYLFANQHEGILAKLHDTALKARPAVHKRQMKKDFFSTSEFCATCHKVNLDVPVNSYRWFRGQNDYDAWHDSGVAHNASRTFYLPPAARNCQDCHMPLEPATLGDVAAKDGMVRSHRFLAVNTALPFIRGDDETIRRTEDFLRDNKLRIDIAAVALSDGPEPGEPVYLPHRTQPALPAGRKVRFTVTVRNLNVGHTFPGGTNDSNEGWVEFTLFDKDGHPLAISGAVRDDGYVDPNAHFFKAVMVDREGRRISRRDAQNIHTAIYANVIGPGTADAAVYDVELPPALASSEVRVRARLLWRKFDRHFTEFAFEQNRKAFARFDKTPDLPVTEIARAEVALRVGSADQAEIVAQSDTIPESEWQRVNDLGIAMLLDGNTRAAAHAFERVARIVPGRIDGYRNLARTYRSEGNLARAREMLEKCEEIKPADPLVAWDWGQVLAEEGKYPEAAAAYRAVLSAFPKDRAAWREIMIVYYRDHKFEDAIAAADEVLKIDPEDRQAHLYRMQAFRAMGGHEVEATIAQAAFEKYQIDESAQQVTQAHRLQHPGDNLEFQPIHVHDLRITLPGGAQEAALAPASPPAGTR